MYKCVCVYVCLFIYIYFEYKCFFSDDYLLAFYWQICHWFVTCVVYVKLRRLTYTYRSATSKSVQLN